VTRRSLLDFGNNQSAHEDALDAEEAALDAEIARLDTPESEAEIEAEVEAEMAAERAAIDAYLARRAESYREEGIEPDLDLIELTMEEGIADAEARYPEDPEGGFFLYMRVLDQDLEEFFANDEESDE
jgi:hypothetical protein